MEKYLQEKFLIIKFITPAKENNNVLREYKSQEASNKAADIELEGIGG